MKVLFTEHAKFQLAERGIDPKEVIETLQFPDQIILSKRGRKIVHKVYKKNDKKWLLRVIFEEKANVKVIVTAYWTTKIEKYLGVKNESEI